MVRRRRMRDAFEVTAASDPRLSEGRYEALMHLCRLLADQIDEAGADAGTRLTAAYLSALKDVERALLSVEPKEAPVVASKLGQLRQVHGRQSA